MLKRSSSIALPLSASPAKKARHGLDKPQPSSPRSLRRVLGIFDAIAQRPEGLSLTELSLTVSSPKSSLLTLVRPLTEDGFLIHANARYQLGPEVFKLAANILSTRKFSNLMRSFMDELLKRTHETIILVTIDRAAQRVSYVDVLESTQLIRYVVPAGVTRPLYTSAAGQLLLAYQDKSWRDAYLKKTKLVALTDRTITDAKVLRAKLERIRHDGISFSLGETVQGACGVAAPIFDSTGQVIAALGIGAPAERATRELDAWTQAVRDVATSASRVLGHNGAQS